MSELKTSPRSGLPNDKRKLLHIPEETSELSFNGSDESFDRKLKEHKQKKKAPIIDIPAEKQEQKSIEKPQKAQT